MCSPAVIDAVRTEWSRRHFLGGLLATAGAAVAGGQGAVVAAAATSVSAPPLAGADVAQGVRLPNGFRQIFDLTHVLSPDTPVAPVFKPMRVERQYTIERDGFTCSELTLNEHTGTHMDAPMHFAPGGASVDTLPPSRLFAPLAVIDIKARVDANPDSGVTIDDIMAWERAHGPLPPGAFVAMYAGWDARYTAGAAFLNADARGTLHAPGFTGEAAEFLVKERDIVGVGVDTLSLDMGTRGSAAHLAILGGGKYGIEVIANLSAVPPVGATVIVGAPKHRSGTGGPVRLLAVV